MKLFFSPTSPYVRKVMACAITRGLEQRVEKVATNPNLSPPELLACNPLSKVPCLVTDDGVALFDSPVICEYLDSIDDALALFPAHGAARWRALKLQAMADGILDASVPRRGELLKTPDEGRVAWIARQKAAVDRTLDMLENDPPHRMVDIGSITVACALGYLDFRFAAENWREGHPRLAHWHAGFDRRPSVVANLPIDDS